MTCLFELVVILQAKLGIDHFLINIDISVVPVKSCYSPVILNPPPLPTKTVEGNKQDEKTTEPVKPVTSPASTSATVPTITEPTEEKSASSHKTLQEVAELHAKLQEALRQQVVL